ncbi:hypothetical protein AATB99_002945 [Listeria monocytogenes]|uniref:hypothetical protein n=1 Tax=Listeria innocua TaxID=1642 RepID=UPI0017E70FE8|nr:hypothetical protein [Listeria innocua]EHE1139533.1 hypothetical protein [Listeria monocytogenes]EHO7443041.1 hypothetical protein [Listeria monocytogenes]EHO9271291.1 hypothetical protein [Listeria monocytogenes]EHQ4556264.1 hypothetical protein [Listeria monocytogenes]EIB9701349.1 hypothetical protein [Listeria monocytogenes]
MRSNGYDLDCRIGSADLYRISVDLASGAMGKAELEAWIRHHAVYDLSTIEIMLMSRDIN